MAQEPQLAEDLTRLQQRYQIDVGTEALGRALACHLALRRLAEGESLDAFALACFGQLIDQLGVNPCLGFLFEDYEIGCEGDVPLCIGLLMVRYLTGKWAHAVDPYELRPDGLLEVRHCTVRAALHCGDDHLVLGEQALPESVGQSPPVVMSRPFLAPGPVTLFRLEGIELDLMHVATGDVVACDNTERVILHMRLHGDPSAFVRRMSGNHYVIAAGDQTARLGLLAKWLGIGVDRTGQV
jgi:L-fucose isomerase-like protein